MPSRAKVLRRIVELLAFLLLAMALAFPLADRFGLRRPAFTLAGAPAAPPAAFAATAH